LNDASRERNVDSDEVKLCKAACGSKELFNLWRSAFESPLGGLDLLAEIVFSELARHAHEEIDDFLNGKVFRSEFRICHLSRARVRAPQSGNSRAQWELDMTTSDSEIVGYILDLVHI
jgi:hypothetical protein